MARTTIACASWPATKHCRKSARVAATIGWSGFTLPLCQDCTADVRANGQLVESWGSITAAGFAAPWREHIAAIGGAQR